MKRKRAKKRRPSTREAVGAAHETNTNPPKNWISGICLRRGAGLPREGFRPNFGRNRRQVTQAAKNHQKWCRKRPRTRGRGQRFIVSARFFFTNLQKRDSVTQHVAARESSRPPLPQEKHTPANAMAGRGSRNTSTTPGTCRDHEPNKKKNVKKHKKYVS